MFKTVVFKLCSVDYPHLDAAVAGGVAGDKGWERLRSSLPPTPLLPHLQPKWLPFPPALLSGLLGRFHLKAPNTIGKRKIKSHGSPRK